MAALGPYEGRLRSAVLSIKFRGARTSAVLMGEWLLAKVPWSFEAIVPVPLHQARLRERGYNQAADVARGLSRASNVKTIDDALVRIRATRPQSSLDGATRRANVAGAFGLGRTSGLLKGARVLLVDDVITTGATAMECGAVLRSAGAVEIYLAAVALRL
jgi:ComF family protein